MSDLRSTRRLRQSPTSSSDGPRPGSGDDPGQDPAELHRLAREIVLRKLSHAPRTRAQLAQSLAEREVPNDVADQVLDELGEVGLIDDEAFSRAWVEGRSHARGLSRSRLRRELLERGIDIEVADHAVADLDGESDEAAARALASRWAQRRTLETENDRNRLVGYLVRRGYGPGLAARIARDG